MSRRERVRVPFTDDFVLRHTGPRFTSSSAAFRPHEYALAKARAEQLGWNIGGVLKSIALGEQKPLPEGPLDEAEKTQALALRAAATEQYNRLRPGF